MEKKRSILDLISYWRIFRKHNLIAGIYIFPVILIIGIPFFIIEKTISNKLNIIFSILVFILYIPLLGLWIKRFVVEKRKLNIQDNVVITGAKTFLFSLLPAISIILLKLVIIFIQLFSVRTLLVFSARTDIVIFSTIGSILNLLFSIIVLALNIASLFVSNGVAVNYLYRNVSPPAPKQRRCLGE